MNTLPKFFNELLSAVQPDQDRVEAAKKYPTEIREYLSRTGAIETVEPPPIWWTHREGWV